MLGWTAGASAPVTRGGRARQAGVEAGRIALAQNWPVRACGTSDALLAASPRAAELAWEREAAAAALLSASMEEGHRNANMIGTLGVRTAQPQHGEPRRPCSTAGARGQRKVPYYIVYHTTLHTSLHTIREDKIIRQSHGLGDSRGKILEYICKVSRFD